MQAVILAGGLGRRLAPYTTVLPKPLMPVGEMPVIEIIIRQLRAAGFTNIEMATGYLSALIEAYCGDGSAWGVRIRYSREHERAGTAGPLRLMRDNLDETFLMMNGDVLTDLDFAEFFRRHKPAETILTAATCRRSITLGLGAIERDATGRISGYLEKPSYSFECSSGIYCMNREVLEHIPPEGIFDLPDLVRTLIEKKKNIAGVGIEGFWLDIGTPDDYAVAVDNFEKYFGHLRAS